MNLSIKKTLIIELLFFLPDNEHGEGTRYSCYAGKLRLPCESRPDLQGETQDTQQTQRASE